MELTEEQLKEIDKIFTKNIENPSEDWIFDGEFSYPTIDVEGTLKNTAIEVKEYLRSIK